LYDCSPIVWRVGEGGQREARLSGVKAEIGREDKSNNVDDVDDERVLLLLLLLLAIEDEDAEEGEDEEEGEEGVPITMFEVASVDVEVIFSDPPKTALTMLLITPNTPPPPELTLEE